MAKKRVRISLNESGLGQIWLDDTDVTKFVKSVSFYSEQGKSPTVELEITALVDVKVDAEVTETAELWKKPAVGICIPDSPEGDVA